MKVSCVLGLSGLVAVAAAATSASEPAESTIEPSISAIVASQATQAALSPLSNVPGKAFQRFYQVWLENTDYSAASGNSDMQWLASQGITLSNYFASTHPSEPNYCAAAAGDNFGMDNDDFHLIPANVSTVVDLLDTKGISWAEYQEGLPYAGFQGFNYSNQVSFANDYVRKHNPLILFDSVSSNATRLSLIKNFTSFNNDVTAKTLPQWAFITPNMTDDGHDTNVTFAASWLRTWLTPLLNNTYFMNGTLLLLTFDEDETYTEHNNIFTVLIGGPDVIASNLHGTTDATFYNHYSAISSVSVNWGLPSLGRWDCEANVFAVVANKTNYTNVHVDTTNLYFNQSYPGPLSDNLYIPEWPVPDTKASCAAGQGVLASVKSTWGNLTATYNYTNVYPYDGPDGVNSGGTPTTGGSESGAPGSGGSGASGSKTSSTAAATSSKSAASSNSVSGVLAVVIALVAAFF